MKKLLATAVTLVLLTSPSLAADRVRLHPKVLGTWCHTKNPNLFVRGNCFHRTDADIVIGADGYEGWEHECRTVKSSSRRDPAIDPDGTGSSRYTINYKCAGEGATWFLDTEMYVNNDGNLVMKVLRHFGENEEGK